MERRLAARNIEMFEQEQGWRGKMASRDRPLFNLEKQLPARNMVMLNIDLMYRSVARNVNMLDISIEKRDLEEAKAVQLKRKTEYKEDVKRIQ